MKFSKDNMILKYEFLGVKIYEAEGRDNYSLDWALVKIENGESPLKINKTFCEMFYIIKGECELTVDGRKEMLKEGDAYTIEQGIPHKASAKYAEIFVACNPPFDIRDVEFLEK